MGSGGEVDCTLLAIDEVDDELSGGRLLLLWSELSEDRLLELDVILFFPSLGVRPIEDIPGLGIPLPGPPVGVDGWLEVGVVLAPCLGIVLDLLGVDRLAILLPFFVGPGLA